MMNLKELAHITIAIIILIFVVNFRSVIQALPAGKIFYLPIAYSFIAITLVVFTNILAKKIIAYYYETTTEQKIWQFQRFGYKPNRKFKKPIPGGIIFPFILTLISAGIIWLMTVLEFDTQGTSARASKRHGIYRFTEMTEFHIALIAASGVIANLILAIIAYLINFPIMARISIYYAAFSLIPFSNLDGAKIFFGSRKLSATLAAITAIALAYAFFLI